MMSVTNENGCIYLTHSRYYYQSPASLPFAPQIYWNAVTDDDVIPVCTYGYKTIQSAQSKIKSQVSNVKKIRLIHVETEEEHKVQFLKYIQECVQNSKSYSNPNL